jgi:cytochrome b561
MASIAPDHRSPAGYTRVAIALHWVIALMVVGNLAGGILSEYVGKGTAGAIMAVHKPLGITVLALSLVRLGWRVAHGFPSFPDSTPGWDAAVARATHVAFYVLMIAVPLAGWAMVSAGPRPLEWFGLFPIPKLPVSEATADAAHGAHVRMAWLWLVLIALHVAGALKHHLVDRDDVLARMLPAVRR